MVRWRRYFCVIWCHFYNLKKREKYPWWSITFSKSATLRKLSLLLVYFSCFLNRANGTKLRKTPLFFFFFVESFSFPSSMQPKKITITFSKPVTLRKLSLVLVHFSRFLNRANGTKLWKTPHFFFCRILFIPKLHATKEKASIWPVSVILIIFWKCLQKP